MIVEQVVYQHADVKCIAHTALMASKEVESDSLPVVLVAHAWSGRDDFACQMAERLAMMGYVGMAIDIYGNEKLGTNNDENAALMNPFMEDRAFLRDRLLAAVSAAKNIPQVDATKIGVIGFCFGGLCALDLARSSEDILGAVSFHGLLKASNIPSGEIKSKVLAFHGYDDPMVGQEDVSSFFQEMTLAKVDWQFHTYGGTMHAFTNPQANDPDFGTLYNEKAAKRSWLTMQNFFKEIFFKLPYPNGVAT